MVLARSVVGERKRKKAGERTEGSKEENNSVTFLDCLLDTNPSCTENVDSLFN